MGLDYYGDYRTVDTHIHRLRDKIGSEYVKTYRGMDIILIFKSNKFGKKLYFMIVIVIVVVFGTTYFLNNFFYLDIIYMKLKKNIDTIYKGAKSMSLSKFEDEKDKVAANNNLTILIIKDNPNIMGNLDYLNEYIQLQLNREKVNINKFWVMKNDLNLVNC